MSNKRSIYKIDRYIDRARNLLDKSKLSKINKDYIIKFVNYCGANSLTQSRIAKYLSSLRIIGELLNKDFDKVDKNDLIKFLAYIQKSDYALNTKRDYKVVLKRFYKWLLGNDEEYPSIVKWIKTGSKRSERTIPTEIVNESEVKKLIQACTNSRDRAIVSVLYESGARIGEIANLERRDVVFDDNGVVIIVDGKTGMRRVRLVASELYLKKYLNEFRHKKEIDPLWIKFNGEKITYSAISKMFAVIVKRSGISKKITPHKLRHARATYLSQHFTESQMCAYLGWVQGSDMPATYIHLSGKDVDEAVLSLYGKPEKIRKPKKSELTPKICKRCSKKNEPTASFCVQCGAPLSIEVALQLDKKRKEADSIMNILLKDNDIRSLIAKKLKGLNR